jgi:hypothetical protein
MIALVCFVVFFPSETSAQRAAVGIGSKLKQTFGYRTSSASLPGNVQTTSQGEQEYDRDGMLLATTWMIATEKPGIAVAMLSFLCGYIYLFLHQRRKIDKIEQAIAGGEFRILAYLLYYREETNGEKQSVFFVLFCGSRNGIAAPFDEMKKIEILFANRWCAHTDDLFHLLLLSLDLSFYVAIRGENYH